MSNEESTSDQAGFTYSLEYYSALVISFFLILFTVWTLASHAATFLNVPWIYLSKLTIFSILFISWAAYGFSVRFAKNYCSELFSKSVVFTLPNSLTLISLAIASIVIFSSNDYSVKYTIVVACILAISLFSGMNRCNLIIARKNSSAKIISARDLSLLIFLIVIAIIFTLCASRPDLDDSSFIQIAAQTLLHQNLAPLSYDTSLGYILDTFRFAPYRISSYETLVALISQWSGIQLFSVYYLVVPGITAGLTMLMAFCFSRMFLSTSGSAIAASAVFLLIMFSWGETHTAYGNRVFVRLFQGKGLIIALTTPFSIIAGLVLIHRPTVINAIMLAAANICAIGVSSSGLVMTLFTSLIICFVAITRDTKKLLHSYLLVAATMIYPLFLAFWLKFQSKSAVSLVDIGTYLPINASLGLSVRESTVLSGLLFGYSVFVSSRKKSYSLIVFSVLFFILNPWFSDLMALITSRNMSWRLAWAAPIPLLLSIGLVGGLGVEARNQATKFRVMAIGVKLASLGLILIFLLSYRWILSAGNNVTLDYPTAKLPADFYSTNEIANRIRTLDINGEVLAHQNVAAWLPLSLPSVRLVMPGHTYPIQLQTVLPKHEFESRMKLFNAINSGNPKLSQFSREMRDFNVELIVLPGGIEPMSLFQSGDHGEKISAVKVDTVAGYSLYRIYYGN